MAEKTHQDDLDWDKLSNPVPLDRIDPGSGPQALPEDLPGSRSEILPRAESEAFAAAHGFGSAGQEPAPEAPATAAAPAATSALPVPDPVEEPPASGEATLQMPARSLPDPAGSGATTFGAWPQDHAEIQDEFSRMRASMEAESEAEKKARSEADQEEASQRERLEQWMANARNRLLKADEDPAGPSSRIRKEHSPSLHRLAEMQKTLWVDAQATRIDSQTASLRARDREPAAPPPLDPMATISISAEQFLALDPSAHQAATRHGREAAEPPTEKNALTAHTAPQPRHPATAPGLPRNTHGPQSPEETAFQPMTREQALTRKVAQLRRAAEAGGNTLIAGPGGPYRDRSALHVAIAAVVIAGILMMGVALFAATQAGFFDGLENRVPFLRPDVPPQLHRPAARAPAAPPSATVDASAGPRANATDAAPGNQPSPPLRAPAAQAASAGRPGNSAATVRRSLPREPARAQGLPASARSGEAALRASVQGAAENDRENLLDMYNRYALGFPGLSGEVQIGLTVDPGGRILEGSVVSSTTGVEAFDQELLRRVLDWRLRAFPEPRPKLIVAPFLFPLQDR